MSEIQNIVCDCILETGPSMINTASSETEHVFHVLKQWELCFKTIALVL